MANPNHAKIGKAKNPKRVKRIETRVIIVMATVKPGASKRPMNKS